MKEAQRKLWKAFFRHDVRKLDRLLIPEGYVHTDIDGNIFDKKSWIAWVARRASLAVTSYDISEIKVQFYKDTAVITARLRIQGRLGRKTAVERIRVTNVWVKSDGKWLRAAYQATRIKRHHSTSSRS